MRSNVRRKPFCISIGPKKTSHAPNAGTAMPIPTNAALRAGSAASHWHNTVAATQASSQVRSRYSGPIATRSFHRKAGQECPPAPARRNGSARGLLGMRRPMRPSRIAAVRSARLRACTMEASSNDTCARSAQA